MVMKKLDRLGLPMNLVKLIRAGTLEKTIQEEYARLDRLNALLDEWERQNPTQYRMAPWYQGREEWKAAGRPRPEWWEVLKAAEAKKALITTHQIENQILGTANTDHWNRVKADPERHKKVTRMRKIYGRKKV